ncbi:MAG: diadenylate cyclase CdaA [Bacilli bacterium]|nr:diadenylate cyclase CdaA [Bacilli bacterium]
MDYMSILGTIRDIVDIAIVWFIIYQILKFSRNNFKLVLIFKGVLIVALLKILSDVLSLNTIGSILEYAISWGPIAIIVIFQPEIRSVLESLGRTNLLGRHKTLTVDEREKLVYELTNAIEYLKKNRIGALIVIERDYSLAQYIEPANKIYADLSSELLISIFFPNNPLHDGGVILQGDKITCAGAVFPTSMNPSISKRLGTRHRAALGISETTDSIAVVVSEETGRISIAVQSTLNYNLSIDDARMILLEELQPKKETFYDADEELDKDEEVTDEKNI